MKTFADYLPTMTARERDIVEEFFYSGSTWFRIFRNLKMMRDAPPAKEPVSVERDIELADGDLYILVPEDKMPDAWNAGDRVRVVKIEETK